MNYSDGPSFFHNQPSSVKRTVDFVSDRLASNVIRDVRQRVIPSIACRGQECVKAWPRKPLLADGQRVDEQLDSLSGQLCQDVRRETSSLLAGVTTTSILDSTLAVLLAKDVLPSVRQVCVAVTVRLTHEKVFDWTERHVTLGQFPYLSTSSRPAGVNCMIFNFQSSSKTTWRPNGARRRTLRPSQPARRAPKELFRRGLEWLRRNTMRLPGRLLCSLIMSRNSSVISCTMTPN